MKKSILCYFKHLAITVVVLLAVLIPFGLYHNASLSYGHNPLQLALDREGPYVFYKNDSILSVNYIRGNKDKGFFVQRKDYSIRDSIPGTCFFPLDSSFFNFMISQRIGIPPAVYNDDNRILAISDIESNYKTFRDFLIANEVIDNKLNWTFGKGHLVLLGDFVDRGSSTIQVLWFIYKLEQEASRKGGKVHFIIGNHELKNMHGDYMATDLKYTYIASILGKSQQNLYDSRSYLGKWLASKNVIESINGNLFVHGGLHTDLLKLNMSLKEVNNYLRKNYSIAPYPKAYKNKEEPLISTKTGLCWYRGYFKENLTQQEVEKPIQKYRAKVVVVGHALQSKVKSFYNGKVIGIDVKHPKDYSKNWPDHKSEGLLVEGNVYYRVLYNGERSSI